MPTNCRETRRQCRLRVGRCWGGHCQVARGTGRGPCRVDKGPWNAEALEEEIEGDVLFVALNLARHGRLTLEPHFGVRIRNLNAASAQWRPSRRAEVWPLPSLILANKEGNLLGTLSSRPSAGTGPIMSDQPRVLPLPADPQFRRVLPLLSWRAPEPNLPTSACDWQHGCLADGATIFLQGLAHSSRRYRFIGYGFAWVGHFSLNTIVLPHFATPSGR